MPRRSGSRLMSVPISARMTSAVRRCTPGIVNSSSTARSKGAMRSSIARRAGDRLVEEIEVSEDRADQKRVSVVEAALQRLAQRGQLLAHRAPRELGQHPGSVVPATSASSIARPETPRMSEATQSSLSRRPRAPCAAGWPRAGARGSASCDTGSAPQVADRLGRHEAGRSSPSSAAGTATPRRSCRSCGPGPV